MIKAITLGFLVIPFLCSASIGVESEKSRAAAVFEDDFSKGMEQWIVEKGEKDKVNAVVEDGKLRVETGEGQDGAMIWLKHELPSDFTFEFDFTPLSPSGFFLLFFCQKGMKGEDILSEELLKDQNHSTLFKKYTMACNGYHISYRRDEAANCNLRKNAGQNLLKQQVLETVLPKDKTVHVKLTKLGGKIKFEVGGKVFMEFEDKEKPYSGGRIGFRQVYASSAHYDNFKLTELK